MPLTDTEIRNTKPTDKPKKLFDGGGLFLLVTPTGARWWRLKYRHAGKEKLLSLGTYPDTTLKAARDKRDAARRLIADGKDPSAERQEAKRVQQVAADRTFGSLFLAWHESWKAGRTEKHAAEVKRRVEADVLPEIGHVPVSSLTAPQLLAMAKKIENRGAVDLARRAYQIAGQVLRYAVAHGLAERNPAADVKPGDVLKTTKPQHMARVDARELPELLRRIDRYDGQPLTRYALQLMALTFVRTSELIGAQWVEIDLDGGRWDIPASRMKMDTPHVVPLSTQAVDVLRRIQALGMGGPLVFPGERNRLQPMSNNTILFALYRMGYRSRMTGHGFRGVASTLLHEQGFDHAHIELQLAHIERNKVAAAYNHATYLPQRGAMMQAWADHLDKLRRGADVVPLRAA